MHELVHQSIALSAAEMTFFRTEGSWRAHVRCKEFAKKKIGEHCKKKKKKQKRRRRRKQKAFFFPELKAVSALMCVARNSKKKRGEDCKKKKKKKRRRRRRRRRKQKAFFCAVGRGWNQNSTNDVTRRWNECKASCMMYGELGTELAGHMSRVARRAAVHARMQAAPTCISTKLLVSLSLFSLLFFFLSMFFPPS